MIKYKITAPQQIDTTVTLPASKSISNRALIICALTGDCPVPQNLSDCDDTEVILRALRDMPYEIDIKAAGTAMRFMTALLASTPCGNHLLTGTERMKHRPIKPLVDALRQLGADIEYAGEDGFPPLRINGKKLEGGQLEIAGNISSQYISALLMIGPVMTNGLVLHLTDDIFSRPYIDLTLWMMKEFGADAEWTAVDTITVKPKPYQPCNYLIENDWSSASYWYEMVALTRQKDINIQLEGLMDGSKQGDSSVRYIFSLLGVKTVFFSKTEAVPTAVTVKKNGHCVPRLEYDFAGQPDLAQTFVVACALKGIPFRFTGLQTLKIKETDRIEALKREMLKLGFVIRDLCGTELIWDGERCEARWEEGIDTYEDHRMALAFAPAALIHPIVINNPHVVTKSYPHYWEDLRRAGFTIEEI